MDYIKRYEQWIEDPYFDEQTRRELLSIKDNPGEIEDRFYKDLEFGTGGLRGKIGAGTNRMNIYTVRRATQGLADYIKAQSDYAHLGVVIAYDSRIKSKEFAYEAAKVLSGNGIKAYIFEDIAPTPLLSFAVRELGAIAGVVITASHNPPQYNGYKVYWQDGGQIVPRIAKEITAVIKRVDSLSDIPVMGVEKARHKGFINILKDDMVDKYLDRVVALTLNRDVVKDMAGSLRVIYTPLHGTGYRPITRALDRLGYSQVRVVKAQAAPDGRFPTVEYPNPEDPRAFDLAMEMAAQEDADLLIATDPDCDRVGVAVKDDTGKFIVLTGNQTGALLLEYILSSLKDSGRLPQRGVMIKTIVTSRLGDAIAAGYGVETVNTLTGFKYIGEKILEYEQTGDKKFLFGYEESYGYLAGTYTRDKDGVGATVLICEMASAYKAKGMTLYQGLMELYEKYGYYKEQLTSLTLEGRDGMKTMDRIMTQLRQNPPVAINGIDLVVKEDYLLGKRYFLKDGNRQEITLPRENVLHFTLEDGSWFCIRPSGTEPKIKIYVSVVGNSLEHARCKCEQLMEGVMARIKPD
ncbi:MAG TPA: phospho-sugar mutase [Clostridiales bacterium]|nr:phospho-sugar mutase [Clostridiales bacterium]